MDILQIQDKISKGEKVCTGFKDNNGDDIYLGNHLATLNGSFVYEVRIRKENFVLHTGGSAYIYLDNNSAKKCIVANDKQLSYNSKYGNELIA